MITWKRTELSTQKPRLNHQEIQGKGLVVQQNTVCTVTSGKGNKKTSTSNDWFSQKQACLLSLSQILLENFLIQQKIAHSTNHLKATSSHNSIPTITIITRFCPQITYSSRINHRQSQVLQGPLSQTTCYNLTEKSHHYKGKTVREASIRPADWLDRPADWQGLMHRPTDVSGDVWLSDRHVYRASEQHGSGPRPTVLKPGMGPSGASKPDKRLLCFGRQQ